MREPRLTPGGAVRYYTPDDPTAVYRFYDEAGRLLYVGVAYDPEDRWQSHRGRDWWTAVKRSAVTWHPDRAAAEREEARALIEEGPVHNIKGVPRRRVSQRPAGVAQGGTAGLVVRRTTTGAVLRGPYGIFTVGAESDAGYVNSMARIRRSFPGWAPPWDNRDEMAEWIAGLPADPASPPSTEA